jgi:nicotinamidase-related amidase
LTDLQKEQYDLDGKLVTCDIKTEGYKFYKLDPAPEDVFTKYNFNAFSNFDLVKKLQDQGIKTVVITGLDTFYCVETAIRNAFDLGYKVVVAEDLVACSAKHRDFHDRTLALVRKTFGIVVRSEELNDRWNQ